MYIIEDKAYIDSGDLLLPKMFLKPNKKLENKDNLDKFMNWMDSEKYNIMAERFRTALNQKNYDESFYIEILKKYTPEERIKFQAKFYRLLKSMEYLVDEFEEIDEFINGWDE